MGASAVVRLPSAAASTNATSGGVGPSALCFVSAYNAAASVRYLKLYDKATAPVVGTDVPVMTIAIQATSQLLMNLGENRLLFRNGLAFALTTGAPDADTGAVTAGDVLGLNLGYA